MFRARISLVYPFLSLFSFSDLLFSYFRHFPVFFIRQTYSEFPHESTVACGLRISLVYLFLFSGYNLGLLVTHRHFPVFSHLSESSVNSPQSVYFCIDLCYLSSSTSVFYFPLSPFSGFLVVTLLSFSSGRTVCDNLKALVFVLGNVTLFFPLVPFFYLHSCPFARSLHTLPSFPSVRIVSESLLERWYL